MATSSITANFVIDDPLAAKAFVDAFVAKSAPKPNLPRVMEAHFETPLAEREFFLNGPYAHERKPRERPHR